MQPALSQEHLAPSALVGLCSAANQSEQARCAAFLRGAAERLQLIADKSKSACRAKSFTSDDIPDFVNYASSHMIADSGEGFALAFNFFANGNFANVPCEGVPGYWSTGHLLSLCVADDGPTSACKFYTHGVGGIMDIEEAASKTSFVCAKATQDRSDGHVWTSFKSWVAEDPKRANEPAAQGYVEMLMATYPCKP